MLYIIQVVAASASIANYCSGEGFNLGFFSNGTPVLSDLPMRIPASQSEDQLKVILETLACISMPLVVASLTFTSLNK